MSLKAFHIVFITVSVVLSLGLGVMCLRSFLQGVGGMQLAWSVLSFGAAGLLVFYGGRILKKLKDVSYL
jgi:hypothetical protein